MMNRNCPSYNNSKVYTLNLPRLFSIFWVFLILYRVPRVLGIGVLYSTSYVTRTIGDFGVTYVFTFFDLLTILIGLLFFFYSNNKKAFLLFPLIIAYNIVRYLFDKSNIFEMQSYEILLTFFVSISSGLIILRYFKSAYDINHLFRLIISACFLTQVFYAISGKGVMNIEMGYGYGFGCLGLGSGSLAIVYASFVLIQLSREERSRTDILFIVVSFIGIVLTGSRSNLLLLFAFLVVYILLFKSVKPIFKLLTVLGLAFSYMFVVFASAFIEFKNDKINSLFELMRGNVISNILDNVSVIERLDSFKCAFMIMFENPFGISCSAQDLVNQMIEKGGTTFPHSYLLCYYLMCGVPCLVVYCVFIKLLVHSRKKKKRIAIVLMYFVVLFSIYGGITTEYLLVFWFYMIYKFSLKTLEEESDLDLTIECLDLE